MDSGSELSKTVATFIIQKILLDESGLSYICQTYERFSHVAITLVSVRFPKPYALSKGLYRFQGKMVIQLAKDPCARLLKHVVRCYLRLSDNTR